MTTAFKTMGLKTTPRFSEMRTHDCDRDGGAANKNIAAGKYID